MQFDMDTTRVRKFSVIVRKRYIGLLYISPWIIGLVMFQLYPFIASFVYSFTDYSLLKPPVFVGFSNYVRMFVKDELFPQSLKVTFLYVLIAVPGKLIFALFIALMVNIKVRGVNVFRTIYYLPSIYGGSVAIAVLWRFLFMREGLVNLILSYFAVPRIDWLGNTKIALFTISLVTIWQFGSSMVIFLAGLKQIPQELYEAAVVDGASSVRVFFFVTLPLLTPIIFFNLIVQIIFAFQQFTTAFVITGGGPLRATYLYALFLYQNAFEFLRMGYASALSWILFIIIMSFTLLIFRSSRYWVHYED